MKEATAKYDVKEVTSDSRAAKTIGKGSMVVQGMSRRPVGTEKKAGRW